MESDLHIHTIASGHGYSTIKENVEAAGEKGLKTIAITDHGLKMPGAPHLYHFTNMVSIPRVMQGIEVLRGVEANILDAEGNIDMPEIVLADYLDIVLAGLHDGTGYTGTTLEENTEAMVAAIKNPFVHVITHPGNPKFPVDAETVVRAAKDYNKALEINNSSFTVRPGSFNSCRQIAKLARKYNIMVSINSDAHICYNVGETSRALALASKEGIRSSQIINTSSAILNEYLTWHKQQSQAVLKKAQ